MDLLVALSSGLVSLPWWGYVVFALATTHVTIAGVTIYLHRYSAHRALDLHPVVAHFFRFWLWMTTGMETRQWTAVHRKHHAKVETPEDPHSPQWKGIRTVLLQGAELYRVAAADKALIEKYGHGTPDDWIERNVYHHSALGVSILLVAEVLCFGGIGATIWAVQMLWIPVTAAGVINGLGHYAGYRNFETEDTSTNIFPWGILIGGEELHNNHHAYGSSARLSSKWYEFDIGWMYIRIMEALGLAHVRKLAPKLRIEPGKAVCDLDTLHAVITHRYEVVQRFGRSLRQAWTSELESLRRSGYRVDPARLKRWLHRDTAALEASDQADLEAVRRASSVLDTIYSMRQELVALWARSTLSKEQLLSQLEDWCSRAERSGIAPLREFSMTLRGYV